MQTAFNFANRNIAKIIFQPFLYLVRIGLNPYIIFLLSAVFVFFLYFLIFYGGNYRLLREDLKRLSSRKKKKIVIFISGGILIAFVLFYESLDLFYDAEGLSRYRSVSLDNLSGEAVDGLISFLGKIGVIK